MRKEILEACRPEIERVQQAARYLAEALSYLDASGHLTRHSNMEHPWIEYDADACRTWENAVEDRRICLEVLDRKLTRLGVRDADVVELKEQLRREEKIS